jgi:hypothetical protein
MTITPEKLAAFADGELPEAESSEIEVLVANDADLARQVALHRALRQRLSTHFAPILDAPLPGHLVARLAGAEPQIVDLAKARRQRDDRRRIPRWAWVAAPALAASLALAVVLPRYETGESTTIDGHVYAAGSLAQALDSQLSGARPATAPMQILLSFKDSAGTYCRGFSGRVQAGIACRDERGWQLRKLVGGLRANSGDYRQAGSDGADLMALAQDMAPDGALDTAQEQAAKARGWR